MAKLPLNLADLKVASFDVVTPQSRAFDEFVGYTTLQACTVPKYSCLIACPSQRAED